MRHILLQLWNFLGFLGSLPREVSLAALMIGVAGALTARRLLSRIVLWTGVAIFILAWIPLLLSVLLSPGSNPVLLGVMAWVGSGLGMIVIAVGLLLRLWEFVRPS